MLTQINLQEEAIVMKFLLYGILVVLILFILYILALRGRTGQKKLADLGKWSYAHRGLHDQYLPENSMGAFRAAVEAGYGMELDLHLLRDGNLGVMHDSSLKRTTGRDGKMEDLTTEQLSEYHLQGTEETIPQFRQVLDLVAGKVPLIIELKSDGYNASQLCQAACRMLEGYQGLYCLESFDPRCVIWLRKHQPQIIRGQLAENFLAAKGVHMPWILKWILTNNAANFLSLPDFIAYRFAHRNTFGNTVCRKVWGIQGVSWTLHSKEEYDTAVAEGWIPIFEGFRP